jgi:hypothetical protein
MLFLNVLSLTLAMKLSLHFFFFSGEAAYNNFWCNPKRILSLHLQAHNGTLESGPVPPLSDEPLLAA